MTFQSKTRHKQLIGYFPIRRLFSSTKINIETKRLLTHSSHILGPSEITKTFVHSLAAHLQTVGFNAAIDLDIDYGNGLSEFMNDICDAKHAFIVTDAPYAERTNTVPSSGVTIENRWISEMIDDKPDSWLSVAFAN